MAYLEVGQRRYGPPLVCVHGSLCDFRIWSSVLGPLTKKAPRDRAVAAAFLSRPLGRRRRHLFDRPACRRRDRLHREARHRTGRPDGPFPRRTHLFRVAQRRPDLLRKLILAEPGGELDATLDPAYKPGPSPLAARIAASADVIADGDIDGGLKSSWTRWKAPAPGSACRQRRNNSCATTPPR